MAASFNVEGVFTPDTLVIGVEQSRKVTIASGAGVLARGTVLGKLTANRKYQKSLSAAADGSQTPDAILAEDVDATSADVEAIVYIAGTFNQSALVLGTGHTLASVDDAFRKIDIFLQATVAA